MTGYQHTVAFTCALSAGYFPKSSRIGTRYYYDQVDVPIVSRKLGLKLPTTPTAVATPQRTRERRRSAMKDVVAVAG